MSPWLSGRSLKPTRFYSVRTCASPGSASRRTAARSRQRKRPSPRKRGREPHDLSRKPNCPSPRITAGSIGLHRAFLAPQRRETHERDVESIAGPSQSPQCMDAWLPIARDEPRSALFAGGGVVGAAGTAAGGAGCASLAGGGLGIAGGETISVDGIKPGRVRVETPGAGGNEGATCPNGPQGQSRNGQQPVIQYDPRQCSVVRVPKPQPYWARLTSTIPKTSVTANASTNRFIGAAPRTQGENRSLFCGTRTLVSLTSDQIRLRK